MKLIIESPINSLSFGNVSFNILREMYKKNVEVGLFPIGNPDFSAYSLDQSFGQWLQTSIDRRLDFLSEKTPVFKLWHLNGGENRKTPKQHLYTFYECSQPTKHEVSVCKSQDLTFFSSKYSKDLFDAAGCNNTAFLPLGFDVDFKPTNKQYLEGVIHFGLMGKLEKRKHTAEIIKAWLKKFGNDNRYQLTCCITNPFFKPEQMQLAISNILGGKRYTNINFLPYLATNKEVNEFLNAIDVDLTGLSGGEGWNLPSFNATCLGKWSVVLGATSHLDWATEENSVMVPVNGEMSSADGFFFLEGQEFNQGVFYTWDEDIAISAMETAANKSSSSNKKGIELGKTMTYSRTVDSIIESFSN